jgi:hypothetical protein
MNVLQSKEINEFYNPRITRFKLLYNHIKEELEQAYATYKGKELDQEARKGIQQKIHDLEEQLQVVQERIDVLEKLKQEKLNEL